MTLDEAQHTVAAGLIAPETITPLSAVITGASPGRSDDTQITLFDGTGVGLQDIAVAARVVALAQMRGQATEVEL